MATHNAASVALADVQAAYDLCVDGDTLSIPAGSATWSGALEVEIAVAIIGAGIGVTNITRAGQAFNCHPTGDKAFRISGLTIIVNGYFGGGNYPILVQTLEQSVANPLTQWRIDHVRIEKSQYSITVIGVNAWGLIDHCEFYNSDMAIQVLGGALVWSYPRVAGTANALFVEDCSFVNDNGSSGTGWSEQETFSSGHGIRLVVRYNTVDWSAYTAGNGLPYEQHGKGGVINTSPPATDELRGPPMIEIYNNTFAVHHTYRMMNLRGGMNIVYNNTFTSIGAAGNVINLTEDDYDADGYMGIDQVTNSFFWDNTHNGVPVDPVIQDPNDDEFIQLDRDYFLHAPDATSGIVTWPDWDGSHNGSFTGSTAQKFYPYTPYQYPHPLQGTNLEVTTLNATTLTVG